MLLFGNRIMVLGLSIGGLLTLVGASASAQDSYASKTIRIVVSFASGGRARAGSGR
jgi:tripartite-type tricarboxylate transporter receptor subunit TctC